MAKGKKYEVDYGCYVSSDSIEASALIEATARYLNAVEFPSIEAICAILGIEESPINKEA